jgi:hypothetical protein
MQRIRVIQGSVILDRIRDSNPRNHALRIEMAKMVIDIMNDFIAEEVKAATSQPKESPEHLSWQKVADRLDISKSAAFARYGSKN